MDRLDGNCKLWQKICRVLQVISHTSVGLYDRTCIPGRLPADGTDIDLDQGSGLMILALNREWGLSLTMEGLGLARAELH